MENEMKLSIAGAVVSAVLALGSLSTTSYAQEMGGGGDPAKTIVQNAAESPNHTTLVKALKAAGLLETLGSAGPFTVLAPTNAAFDELPPGVLDTMLLPENKEALATVLKCHVIEGQSLTTDIAQMAEAGTLPAAGLVLDTMGGCKLKVGSKSDGVVTLTDENGKTANVIVADVLQSNGVIDVVDSVIKPVGM